ncbi:beta-N-acetylhexosaminidase [Rhizosphaericola mali]|uniref:Family 20 glycosylhydrolase n=1 Tax=Rhizosphaericola mali TaxID=2545455 RepID=A0A5P2G0X8_9BACT|nr:glycoside hydrolase family 20 protein [Rhizosphaericola mali]QES89466.1 family 20 glycosylhydrolase [Rhizosphaericola mali]
MKTFFYCFVLIWIFISQNLSAQTNSKPFVIPSLQQWEGQQGLLSLKNICVIVIDGKNVDVTEAAKILNNDFNEIGIKNTISQKIPKNATVISLKTSQDKELGKEGYTLDIDKIITIEAPHYKGLIWGTRTLLQLIEQAKKKNTGLAKGKIIDFPKYPSRGFILDDGRKFFSLEFLKRYVKMLSYYKISEFQIHLNDNGFQKFFNNNWDSTYAGFALESSTYPKLNKNGEFYTKKDFIALQKLALQYGVTIIPEIDVPAHSLAITQVFPQIASKKYGADHLDLANPATEKIVDNIFKEYISGANPVFVGPYVHIGTDEYAKAESERFRAFTDHLIHFVQGYGKQVRAWGALTHATGTTPVISKDVTLNIWYNGYADPIEMKRLGYKLISTPDGFVYIVPAAGYYYDYLDLPYLYKSWTPLNVGNVKFEQGDTSLVGGSFAVWNDIVGNGITAMDVHNRVFPALQVLAEKMWSNVTDTNNYNQFAKDAFGLSDGKRLPLYSYPLPLGADSIQLRRQIWNPTTKGVVIDRKRREVNTSIEHLGFQYCVAFDIKAGNVKVNTPLFSDDTWRTELYLLPNRKIAFKRENYIDTFDYNLPEEKNIRLTFSGTNNKVTLKADGELVSTLHGYSIPKNAKDTMFYVQTLSFPLKKIGDKKTPLNGSISNLSITVFRNPKEE